MITYFMFVKKKNERRPLYSLVQQKIKLSAKQLLLLIRKKMLGKVLFKLSDFWRRLDYFANKMIFSKWFILKQCFPIFLLLVPLCIFKANFRFNRYKEQIENVGGIPGTSSRHSRAGVHNSNIMAGQKNFFARTQGPKWYVFTNSKGAFVKKIN